MSKKRLYFCADLGTSSLKAALVDSEGCLHGFARVYYANAFSASWLDAFYRAAEQLASSLAPAALVPVSAVCISGGGPTLAPVTGDNCKAAQSPRLQQRPLYWYDPLPVSSSNTTQGKKTLSLFLPKVKAFLDSDPQNFSRTKLFFSPQEWLSWKLGSRPVTVLPHDGYIPYYWDDDQCKSFGIDQELFPPFVKMGEIIGEFRPDESIKESPASKLLTPDIPLVAGAADFIMALIGTGTLEPGMACDRTGSSEGINYCTDTVPASLSDPRGFKPQIHLRLLPHALPGLWNLGAVIPKSGTLFEEYRASAGLSKKPYNELVKEIFADNSHPGKTVLETIGRSFVRALNDLENSGCAIHKLILSGGQSADPVWNQYKADICGKMLYVPEIIHAELAGNAILCEAAFSGKSIRQTAAEMIRVKEKYIPV